MTIGKQIRYRLEWLGIRLLRMLVPRLPRRGCVWLARFLGALIDRFDRRSREVALANLEAAFPGRYDPDAARRVVRESFQNFARPAVDLFWAPRLKPENRDDYFEFHGLEAAQERHRTNHGTLYFTFHFGHFEWLSLAMGLAGLPAMVVAQEFKNPRLTDEIRALREMTGHTLIDQEKSLLRILKRLRDGGVTGFLVDLTLPPSRLSGVIECFGLKTSVTLLHILLHERTRLPLTPALALPLSDGRCRVEIGDPLSFPRGAGRVEMAQACWNVLEERIRQNPEYWLWSYKHWRYRPRDAGRSYPFYANVSTPFEKKLREQELRVNPPDPPSAPESTP